MKLAVIFNGQGAHYEKMGLDFVDCYPQAKDVFDLAESVTGYPLIEWLDTDIHPLKETQYAQPAIVATSLAVFASIKTELPAIAYMAGLSLGEYSALVASGYLSMEEGFKLIKARGQLMSEHCQSLKQEAEYQMAAVINMPLDLIESLVQSLSTETNPLYLANYNAPTQIVVAGSKQAIDEFKTKAKEAGYRKVLPLKVEGPFHTPLMTPVVAPFKEVLQAIRFEEPTVDVISNVTVQSHETSTIQMTLAKHLVEPIKWFQTIHFFKEQGVTHILQIGPGDTLAKLAARDDEAPEVRVIDKIEDVEMVKAWLTEGGAQ